MSYRWSAGKVDSGDINFSEDLDDHTKIDFEIDQIKLVANNTEYLSVTTGSVNVAMSGVIGINGGVTILENGRVGIGTTAPDYKLDVAGNVGVNQYIYHNGDANTFINFTDNRVRINAGGNNHIDCQDESSAPHKVRINNGGNNIDFVIKDNSNNVYFTADASTSRVGIGTSTPSETLHVAGNLEVSGNDPRIKINGFPDSHPGLEFYENGTRKWIIFNNYGDDSLDFKTNSTTRMVINQDGTVGIGTQSPSTTLDINGTTKSNFYTTTVTTQDLGNGTSSTLSTTSGIVLLDADSITGNDMGGGVEAHTLIFPTPSVSGQKLTIIAQNANTNSTFILPAGLISGSYQSLHDASGISAVTFVQIVEGSHKAWYQV